MASRLDIVVIGIKGTVLAVDRESGETLWSTELKGSDFVNVTLDGSDVLPRPKAGCTGWMRAPARSDGATNCPASAGALSPSLARRRPQRSRRRDAAMLRPPLRRPPRVAIG